MAHTRTGTTGRTGRTGKGAAGRTNYRNTNRTNYIYDNTARRLDVVRRMEEEPRRVLSNETRKNRDKARHMSLGYVAFLMAALTVCALILINYIQVQSDLTNSTKEIARLESRLNTLKLSNDEEYNRITSSVDLEEIKRVAIGELGMTYAKEGQIVTYDSIGNDYMRKVTDSTN